MKTIFTTMTLTLSLSAFAAPADIECSIIKSVNPSQSIIEVTHICLDYSKEKGEDIISMDIIDTITCDLETDCFEK